LNMSMVMFLLVFSYLKVKEVHSEWRRKGRIVIALVCMLQVGAPPCR
jgi:hypothetical protein